MSTRVYRKPVRFHSDPKRVITRYFFPGSEKRVQSIIQKVIDMPSQAAKLTLNQSLRDFSNRHRNISKIFQSHFDRTQRIMNGRNGNLEELPDYKKLLIGAYLTSEYSIESAAFFNPSIVEDPDQTGLMEGERRVILSFRATGEGHISSIVFRGGILDEENNLKVVQTGKLVDEAEIIRNKVYQKDAFFQKLKEMNLKEEELKPVSDRLRFEFDYNELILAINEVIRETNPDDAARKKLKVITWLADSHYEITFSLDTGISDRVIFPIAASESNGIEDARFVKFTDNDGTIKYFATYTAYNGFTIMPKMIETKDFYHFEIMPIHGEIAQNKGMALFPRRINGKYAMLSRIDGINNYIMFSDNINIWHSAKMIQEPKFPWEFIQVGNCGSPIETEHGWLVITHGVGTMRKYCLGATLLDLHDPTKVIGQLSEPLLMPNEDEREGYVPNVVYSCGSIIHNNQLVLPYAMSDTSSTYAAVPVDDLLERLIPSGYSIEKKDQEVCCKKIRILVVEDEPINQKIISSILHAGGYEVEVAHDGIVALIQISKGKFDLILSDIAMPNFNGYQLLDYINDQKIKIPVVFLSGFISEEEEAKGLKMGAVEYIRKPVNRDILLARLDNIFKKKED